ncbi:cytidylate kinase [Kineococcus xinjiangensis]|uniref:Cytidylate kinase n=1 Tax=Kineococcus xinjiangensis TaxID=512762 RepID=A0A2S6IC71_9ACTN|nr:cytidylate kinase [Kineococcus xinjiangensis]
MVAVDGPSGSGKSSVCRAAADRLRTAYLDTGAMYRAATWSCLQAGVDLTDGAAVAAHVRSVPLVMGTDPHAATTAVGDVDVTEAVRSAEVTAAVSAVASVPAVRADLVLRQRALIDAACAVPAPGRRPGVVVEGRDITTVVAPQAPVRVLLTAREDVRLARRARQDLGSADSGAVAAVRDAVVQRDLVDSRTTDFLVAADGVVTLDSSDLDFEGTVVALLGIVEHVAAVPQ